MEGNYAGMACAWVDERHRIVSFLPHAGFRRLQFRSHREMLLYVVDLGRSGYGIL